MSKPNNLTGRTFGSLTVLGRESNDRKGNTMWRCKCSCGKEIVTHSYCLTGGTATSCGCKRNESLAKFNRRTKATHRETHTRLYRIWRGMRERCNNPSNTAYEYYGGRGIKIFEDWNTSYEAFRDWALAHGYNDSLSIFIQGLIGAVVVTSAELISGIVLNLWLGMNVWSYSDIPFNFMGQICLPFSLLWVPVSMAAIVLDDYIRFWLFGERRPAYTLFKRRNP